MAAAAAAAAAVVAAAAAAVAAAAAAAAAVAVAAVAVAAAVAATALGPRPAAGAGGWVAVLSLVAMYRQFLLFKILNKLFGGLKKCQKFPRSYDDLPEFSNKSLEHPPGRGVT